MRIDVKRGGKWFFARSGVRLRRLKTASLLGATHFALTITSLLIVTFGTDPRRWSGRLLAINFIAALYLKTPDKLFRLFSIYQSRPRPWVERKLNLARSIADIPKISRRSPDKVRIFREQVLECAAASIAELLNQPADSFVATLLIFEQGIQEMVVVARSSPARPTGHKYPCNDNLIAWTAVKRNDTIIVDDIKGDIDLKNHYRELNPRPYRSIAGLPIAKNGKSFAALCVDSINPYEFVARKEDLSVTAQPYIALLGYTFGDDDPHYAPTSDDDQYRAFV